MISVQPFGDNALLVNFERRIDKNIHQQVLAMQDRLTGTPGIQYMIPAYCSLTVVFDPQATSVPVLQEMFQQHRIQFPDTDPVQKDNTSLETHISKRVFEIPICYDDDFALDLKFVSMETGKTSEEIIKAHLSTEFYVYMLGFMPGFAYMGDMPEDFVCRRKGTPRTHVPAGSVALSGRQTGIYPFESPGGWQIIGRTPILMFDPARKKSALLKAGDGVKFRQISRSDFDRTIR